LSIGKNAYFQLVQATFFNTAIILLHFVGCLFLPGLALLTLLGWRDTRWRTSDLLVLIIASGALWSTSVHWLISMGGESFGWSLLTQLSLKYGADALLVAVGLLRCRDRWITTVRQLISVIIKPENAVSVCAALLLGLYAVLFQPCLLDNAALYSISDLLANPVTAKGETQGSPSYISWLQWPLILSYPGSIPSMAASGSKIILMLLALWTLHCLFNALPQGRKTFLPLAALLLLITSFHGQYGLLETGKETVFSILFLFGSAARLIRGVENDDLSGFHITTGAWFSLALGFGAITVPYAQVLLGLYLIVSRDRHGISRLLGSILAWCTVPLALTLSALLHFPLWLSVIGILSTHVLIRFFGGALDRLHSGWSGNMAGRPAWVIPVIWTLLVLITWGLLPVTYPHRSMFPLDGSPFSKVFLSHNAWLQSWVCWMAVCGMCLGCTRHLTGSINAGLSALAMFPFATIIPSLTLAHFPTIPLPIHTQHLWDLAKDIPNWCWGPLVVFFSLLLVLFVWEKVSLVTFDRLPHSPVFRKVFSTGGFVMVVLCVGFHYWGYRTNLVLGLDKAACFDETGGARNGITLSFLNTAHTHVVQSRKDGHHAMWRVVATENTCSKKTLWDFLAVGVRPFSNAAASEVLSLQKQQKFFLIANADEAANLFREQPASEVRSFRELARDGSECFIVVGEKTGAEAVLQMLKSPPFRIPNTNLIDLLLQKQRLIMDDFADSDVKTKDGDPYMWCKPGGVMWLELPGNIKSRTLEFHVRLFGGQSSRLVISSPVMSSPATALPGRNKLDLPLVEGFEKHCEVHQHTRWVRLDISYEGDLIRSDRQPYLKSIRLDRLALCGHVFLK
jgi:hypothetical protein